MGQNISSIDYFNRSREGYPIPPWFVVDHDITPQIVRSVVNFVSAHQLTNPGAYSIKYPKGNNPATALYLYIYHRIGLLCPELVRINLEIDEVDSISFNTYDKKGVELGKSLLILIFDTILNTLSQVSSSIELHSQACCIVKYMSNNSISASVYLEIVNTILSAVILFTNINVEDEGISNILKVYSCLYEIYFELNCSATDSDNVTLPQVMLKNGSDACSVLVKMKMSSSGFRAFSPLVYSSLISSHSGCSF